MKQQLPAEGGPTGENLPEPCEWLSRYGDSLYRYALSRLRRSHDAEEAVQVFLSKRSFRVSGFHLRP